MQTTYKQPDTKDLPIHSLRIYSGLCNGLLFDVVAETESIRFTATNNGAHITMCVDGAEVRELAKALLRMGDQYD